MANDIVERFQTQGASIDSVWTMFLLVHGALVASVYFGEKPLSGWQRGIILIAYAIFVLINAWALYDSYSLLNDIVLDASSFSSGDKTAPFDNTIKAIASLKWHYSNSIYIIFIVHLFAAGVVFFYVAGGGFLSFLKQQKRAWQLNTKPSFLSIHRNSDAKDDDLDRHHDPEKASNKHADLQAIQRHAEVNKHDRVDHGDDQEKQGMDHGHDGFP